MTAVFLIMIGITFEFEEQHMRVRVKDMEACEAMAELHRKASIERFVSIKTRCVIERVA